MQETKDVLIKKTIKVIGAETKQISNGNFMTKLKDNNGDTFVMFHTKKDGTESNAFKSFKTFPMSGINSFIDVVYKEESFEKEGKEYTSKKVLKLDMNKQPEQDIPPMKLSESKLPEMSTTGGELNENTKSETNVSEIPF